ncbi:MAG TPA: hypothetical protein DFR83_18670 [Deltaproteobacteria bacterium]|nr:hypothetical protein [Deltaproteobacteria bacterium]
MSASAFLDRVFANLPSARGSDLQFNAWRHAGRPTSEGVGTLGMPGIDVDALAATIMNVGEYRGNIDYVEESRVIADPQYAGSKSVRFYQRVKVPMLAQIQMELVITDFGERDGWRVVAWHMLESETERLNPRQGARSDYNVGAWLLKPDAVAYALSSAPKKKDVGRLKFAALTRGADASAAQVVKANIKGMVAWSRR